MVPRSRTFSCASAGVAATISASPAAPSKPRSKCCISISSSSLLRAENPMKAFQPLYCFARDLIDVLFAKMLVEERGDLLERLPGFRRRVVAKVMRVRLALKNLQRGV